MTDAEDLRKKAQQCRELAYSTIRPEAAEQLLRWAEDYEEAAEVIEKTADEGAVARAGNEATYLVLVPLPRG